MDELLPTARDLMTSTYLAVRPSVSLLKAVSRLERYNEDAAFVIDERGRLIGMLTEKHCLRTLAARAYDESGAATVADIMVPAPPPVTAAADAYTMAQTFWACPFGVLPVVAGERMIGAVTQLAVLRALLAILSHRSRILGIVEQTVDDLACHPESIERLQRLYARLDRRQLLELFRKGR